MKDKTLQASSLAMSTSIGIAMQNATTNQQNGQQIGTATVGVSCAQIVKAGLKPK